MSARAGRVGKTTRTGFWDNPGGQGLSRGCDCRAQTGASDTRLSDFLKSNQESWSLFEIHWKLFFKNCLSLTRQMVTWRCAGMATAALFAGSKESNCPLVGAWLKYL